MVDKDVLVSQIKDDVQRERREINKLLFALAIGEEEHENAEDIMRAVGELNATYNHIVAIENDIEDISWYCVLKHISTAVVLYGEIGRSTKVLYGILELISDGRITSCKACKDMM